VVARCRPSLRQPPRIAQEAAQDYGIYIVDTGSNTYMMLLFELNDQDLTPQTPMASCTTPTSCDLQIILGYLQLVTNNSPTTIGGVGSPIVTQVAPPFTY